MGPAHLLLLILGCAPAPTDGDAPAETGAPPDTAAPADSGDTGDSADTGNSADTADTGAVDTAPPPTDADGDGAWTPDDCDDTDATVFPGAADPCDDIDQDCDGVTWSPGSCSEVRGWDEVVRQVTTTTDGGNRVYPVGDTTGDGRGDFLARTDRILPTSDGDVGSGLALYEGGERRDTQPLPPEGSLGCIVHPIATALRPGGDLNGDGLGDYIDENLFDGGYGIIFSPLPTDGTCFDVFDGYDAFYENYWFGEPGVGAWWSVDGDLDGDGLPDLVSSEFGDPREYGYDIAVADVFLGGEYGLPRARLTVPGEYVDGRSGEGMPHIVEDLDGDGLAELAITENMGDVTGWVISGPDAAGVTGSVDVTDLALATLRAGTIDVSGPMGGIRSAGDWNGDGTADLLIEDEVSATLGYKHGELFVLDGTNQGDVTLDDAVGSWVGSTVGGELAWVSKGNFSGERDSELLVFADDTWYIEPHRLPSLREPVGGLRFLEGDAYIGDPPGDVDGDGRDDLPVALLDLGTAGLWYGWDIPFDDAAAW